MEVFFKVGTFGIVGEIAEFEGIFLDVEEFKLGAVLVAARLGEGVGITGGGKGEPALKLRSGGAGVLEFDFGSEVPDEFVFLGANRADAVVFGAVVDTFGGHDTVDVFLVALLSGEDGEEALPSEIGGWGPACSFDESREEIEILDHGRIDRAGFDCARPAGDEAGLEAIVVAGPFGEGEGAPLLGGHDEEGVIGEAVFLDEVHRLANLGVEVSDLSEVAAHAIASFRGVDEVGREFNFLDGIARTISEVPRGVGFVGAEKEAEGLLFGGLFFDERADLWEVRVLAARDFLPTEDLGG